MFDLKNLPRKPDSRSWFAGPERYRSDLDQLSPAFPVSADDLWMLWCQVTGNARRIVQADLDEVSHQSLHVQLTPYLRFPDEVRAEVIALPDGRASIAVYSQSRYGLYDLGVNRKRVGRWLSRLDRRVMAFRRFQRREASQELKE